MGLCTYDRGLSTRTLVLSFLIALAAIPLRQAHADDSPKFLKDLKLFEKAGADCPE